MQKLFISYRSLDSAKVDPIVENLRSLRDANGQPRYTVWQDKTDIHEGQDWWEAIVDAIIGCDVFVLMVSREAIKNVNCLAELSYARKRNRPVLPLVLDGEYAKNPVTSKHDIPFWGDVPDDLTDFRTQFLFYEKADGVMRVEQAVQRLLAERERWPDISAPRPRDPRETEEKDNSTIALYDEACDFAGRLEFATAERLFQRLITTRDPNFYHTALEWITLLRSYQELIDLQTRESTRYLLPKRWTDYAVQFPKPFLSGGIFDPKGIQQQVDGNVPTSYPTKPVPVMDVITAPRPPGSELPRIAYIGLAGVMVMLVLVALSGGMSGPNLAGVIITMVVFYAGLAALVAGINTIIVRLLRLRTKALFLTLRRLLNDPALFAKFATHPNIMLVKSPEKLDMILESDPLRTSQMNPVTWLPPDLFADVLVRILIRDGKLDSSSRDERESRPQAVRDLEDLRAGIENIQSSQVREALEASIFTQNDLEGVRFALEKWYDFAVSDLTSRFTQMLFFMSLSVAAVLCLFLNIDALMIGSATFNSAPGSTLPLGWVVETGFSCTPEDNEVMPPACSDGRNAALLLPHLPTFSLQAVIVKLYGLVISIIATAILAPVMYNLSRRLAF